MKRAFVFLAIFAPVATLCLLSSCDNKSTNSDGGSNAALDTNTYGISWNSAISYGILTDSRDGQCYRTVKIGTQTWMAQNLNYKVDSSWCYANSADSCSKYGRLYQWAALMGLDSSYNDKLWSGMLPHQGICPSGWHVPSDTEWTTLITFVGGEAIAGARLKSMRGWRLDDTGSSGNGTDAFGFRVLPAGMSYDSPGSDAEFWSSSEGGSTTGALIRYFNYGNDYGGDAVTRGGDNKVDGNSLRCLKN